MQYGLTEVSNGVALEQTEAVIALVGWDLWGGEEMR